MKVFMASFVFIAVIFGGISSIALIGLPAAAGAIIGIPLGILAALLAMGVADS